MFKISPKCENTIEYSVTTIMKRFVQDSTVSYVYGEIHRFPGVVCFIFI